MKPHSRAVRVPGGHHVEPQYQISCCGLSVSALWWLFWHRSTHNTFPISWHTRKPSLRASRNFEGSSWVVYDRCYRRQAAATKNLVWSIPDSALYNEAFTGRAKAIPCCQHCLSENHTLSDCPDCPLDIQREHRHQQDRNLQVRGGFSSEYCQLFNQIQCRSRRYQHLCNLCSLPHPAQVCPMRGRGQRDQSHPSSPRRGREIPGPHGLRQCRTVTELSLHFVLF